MKGTLLSVLSLLALHGMQRAQTTLTLQCLRDAAIGFHDGAGTAGNNYGSAIQNAAYMIPSVAAANGSNGNRALIDFSLQAIPANAQILSAHLNLYATGPIGSLPGHIGAANSCYLERIIQPWGEFTVTWNNQPSTTGLNQVTLPQSTSSNQDYLNINVLALVQDMKANPSTSHGFLLRLVNAVNTNGLLFYSKDYGDPAKAPKLVVTYDDCVPLVAGPVTPTVCSGSTAVLGITGSSPAHWYSGPSTTSILSTAGNFTTPPLYATGSPDVVTYYAAHPTCTALPRAQVQVTVYPMPALGIALSTSIICNGSPASLFAFGAQSYTWTTGSNNAMITVTPSVSTNYQVTGVSFYGCMATAATSIYVYPLPTVSVASTATFFCLGSSATLSAAGASTYVWLQGPNNLGSGTSLVVTPSGNTIYTVTGTHAQGCTASNTIALQVSECLVLDENPEPEIRLWPNPCSDSFKISSDIPIRKVEIVDLNGKLFKVEEPGKSEVVEVNTFDFLPGIYLCKLYTNDGRISLRRLIVAD